MTVFKIEIFDTGSVISETSHERGEGLKFILHPRCDGFIRIGDVAARLRDGVAVISRSALGDGYVRPVLVLDGGEIALQYALAHPNRVSKLILANTCARTSPWLKKIGDGWNEVAKTGNGYAYYLTTIPVIYSTEFFIRRAEWMEGREAYLTEYFSNKEVLERLIRLTDSSVGYDVTSRLGEINCPTLVISASEDGLVPPTEQQILAEGIKNSVYVTINGNTYNMVLWTN